MSSPKARHIFSSVFPQDLTGRLVSERLTLAARYYAVGVRRTIRRYIWNGLTTVSGGQPAHDCLLLDDAAAPPFQTLVNRVHRARRGEIPSLGSFVIRFKGPVIVEPKYGWATSRLFCLEDLSLTYGWQTHSWRGREWLGLPSPVRVLWARLTRKSVRDIPRAVSLVSPWPENYFHFFTDVLPKLLAFERAGLPATLPVLVAAGLADMRFFREACRHGELRHREFVPIDAAVRVQELYVAQGPDLDAATTGQLLSLLGHEGSEPIPGNRVFVTRSPGRGRTIENFHELIPAIEEAGFRIIDLDDASFDEQMRVFGSLELLAGIHGAGLVNLLYCCGRSLPVFEILPDGLDEEMDCFRAISTGLGFPFRRFHGRSGTFMDKRASFSVDPERFGAALRGFVEEYAGR